MNSSKSTVSRFVVPLSLVVVIGMALGFSPTAEAALINVSFNTNLTATVVSPYANGHWEGNIAAPGQNLTDDQIGVWANPLAANWWNYSSPSASSLIDAAGVVTPLSVTVAGSVLGAGDNWTGGAPNDDLVSAGYYSFNPLVLTTTISGVSTWAAGSSYNLIVYHADDYAATNVTVNGVSASAYTGLMAHPYTDAYTGSATTSDFWYFQNVPVVAGNFVITSSGGPAGFFTITGFQIEAIPEPSTFMLFGLGGLMVWRRFRRNRK